MSLAFAIRRTPIALGIGLLALAASAVLLLKHPQRNHAAASERNQQAVPNTPFAGPVAAYLEQNIPEYQKRFQVPGVAVAVIEDGETAWARGFGVLRADRAKPVIPDTVMEAASLSKPFFAYAVLKLVDDGTLDLDTPLVEYLGRDYLDNEPRHRSITARMVLTHTSGLPNWREGGSDSTHRWEDRIGGPLTEGGPVQLQFNPGEQFSYSGEGFVMLQRTIERMTDKSLAQWSEEILIHPLGLTNTSFAWNDRFRGNAARGHDRNANLTDRSDDRVTDTNAAVITAAGSLYTSANDYARFLMEMITKDRSASHSVSTVMLREMLTPQFQIDDSENAVGLGWMLGGIDRDPVAYHSGNNGDFRCFTGFWPASGNGLVIFANASGAEQLLESVLRDLEQIVTANTANNRPRRNENEEVADE